MVVTFNYIWEKYIVNIGCTLHKKAHALGALHLSMLQLQALYNSATL